MNEELKQLFKELEEQGWEPKLCDTPVPYYENVVMCGNPADVGDLICGMEMYPKDFFDNENDFMVTVKGDSMIGANIFEGDRVKVRAKKAFNDGDILVLMIDGEYTMKAFFKDSDGKPWLIPKNPKYYAFSPCDHQNVRVLGVVEEVIHFSPRIDYRSCLKEVNRAKQAETKPKEITREQADEAIKTLANEIKVARLWYSVFKVMMEKKVINPWDYDTFCIRVKNAVPEHEHLPTRLELQRMAVKSFAKATVLWDENDAPVKGTRFNAYVKLVDKTKELLEKT